MKEKNKNLFEKKNLFETSSLISGSNAFVTKPVKKEIHKEKFINDFDSTLILEKIDKTVKNKAVKINLKINTLERNLAFVAEELDLLELLKLEKDNKKREDLIASKKILEDKLAKLKNERKKFGLIYSISGFINEKIDFNKFKNYFTSFVNEVKKYDKIAINYLKSKDFPIKDISLSLFK